MEIVLTGLNVLADNAACSETLSKETLKQPSTVLSLELHHVGLSRGFFPHLKKCVNLHASPTWDMWQEVEVKVDYALKTYAQSLK